jgi:ADP-ribose pyrophosphatase
MVFKTLFSKLIYQGRAFSVRQDELLLPNGQTTRLDIVVHPGAVVLLPVDETGQIWFVRQYRHSASKELLELPAGTLEEGEAPERCAGRELREEIGMSASNIRKIGDFFLAPGYSTEHLAIFLATGLSPDPLPRDEDEFIQVEKIAIGQALKMAEAGEFQDAKTLAALVLGRPFLLTK